MMVRLSQRNFKGGLLTLGRILCADSVIRLGRVIAEGDKGQSNKHEATGDPQSDALRRTNIAIPSDSHKIKTENDDDSDNPGNDHQNTELPLAECEVFAKHGDVVYHTSIRFNIITRLLDRFDAHCWRLSGVIRCFQ